MSSAPAEVAADVVVVGGGLAGLAAARALREAGRVVRLLEAERPGGVLATSRADGYLREHAASSVLASPAVLALAAAVGVELIAPAAAAHRRYLFVGGALHPIPIGPWELVRSGLVSARGKLRFLAEPFGARRPDDREETADELLRRRLGDEAARRVGAAIVGGIYAADPATLSAEAALPALAALDAEGGIVVGSIARRLRARRRGEAPAGRRRIVAPREGMGALVDALVADLGAIVRPGAAVASIARAPGGVAVGLADGATVHARLAVLAVPAPVAAGLVADEAPGLARELAGFATAAAAVVHLGVRRDELRHPLDGFGLLVGPDEGLGLVGCVFESALWPGRAPDGHALLRCVVGGARDPDALARSDDALIDRCVGELGRVLGERPRPRHAHVVRWRHGLPQYRLGHRARVARAEAIAGAHRVVLAGTSYHGVGVAAAIGDAARVVAAVGARLGVVALGLGLAAALAACSAGGGGSAARADGGGPPGPARPRDAAPPTAPTPGGGRGTLEVVVEWPGAPAALRTSPGPTACGTLRRAPLQLEGLGGVRGAIVALTADATPPAAAAPAADPPPPALAAIRGCGLVEPAIGLRVGQRLALENRDADRREVALVGLGALDAPAAPTPRGAIGLGVIGARRELPPAEPGLLRLDVAGGDPALVVVGDGPIAATGGGGLATFADLPAGRHVVRVVHPAVGDDPAPRVVRVEVAVAPDQVTREVVVLGGERAR